MIENDSYKSILKLLVNPISYTDRVKRDMKLSHFNEEMIKDIILNPKKIEWKDENNVIVFGEKTAKLRIEIIESSTLLIHWFEYNKVPFIV